MCGLDSMGFIVFKRFWRGEVFQGAAISSPPGSKVFTRSLAAAFQPYLSCPAESRESLNFSAKPMHHNRLVMGNVAALLREGYFLVGRLETAAPWLTPTRRVNGQRTCRVCFTFPQGAAKLINYLLQRIAAVRSNEPLRRRPRLKIAARRPCETGKVDRRIVQQACVLAARRAQPLRSSIDSPPHRWPARRAVSHKLTRQGRRRILVSGALLRK